MTIASSVDEKLSALATEEKAALLAGSSHWLSQALPSRGIPRCS